MTKFHIKTFGCQTNVLDSEVVRGQMLAQGLVSTDNPEEADVVLLNGCTIRDTADQKVYTQLLQLTELKAHRPSLTVGVLGCLAQAEGEAIRKRFPVVDVVMGPDSYRDLPAAILRARDIGIGTTETRRMDEFLPYSVADRQDPVRAFVEIIRGCSKFCTFCIVPATRGLERSRPLTEVVQEVRELGQKGIQEVTLLGQNVDSYKDLETGADLADLLEALDADQAVPRLRFVTSHPRHFSDRIIDAVAKLPRVCEYVHLPVQSGSDKILRAMNRHTTAEGYLALAKKIRSRIKGVSLSTDLIVGFPGETEKDFQDTLDLVEAVDFDAAFTFRYAPRRNTPAAEYANQVPEAEKKKRLGRLNELMARRGSKGAAKRIGESHWVLVEADLGEKGMRARLRSNQVVFLEPGSADIGTFHKVKITGAKKWSLRGEIHDS